MTTSDPRTPQTADCVLIWYWSFVDALPATVRTVPRARENTSCPPVLLRSFSSLKFVLPETLMIVLVWFIFSSAMSALPVTIVKPVFSSSPSVGSPRDVPFSSRTSNVPLLFS